MSVFFRIANIRITLEVFERDFILFKTEEGTSTALFQVARAMMHSGFDFIDEVIHSEREILVKLNGHFQYTDLQKLVDLKIDEEKKGSILKWPVLFDGPDWSLVTEHTGLSKEKYINKLVENEYEVRMRGFLPGFVYAGSVEKALRVPRKSRPEKRVSSHSIAVAEEYIGLYSLPSPGGWHVIGHMPCAILNYPEIPPVFIKPGDRIRLVAVVEEEAKYLAEKNINIMTYNGLD